jgi:hypothetical protein
MTLNMQKLYNLPVKAIYIYIYIYRDTLMISALPLAKDPIV